MSNELTAYFSGQTGVVESVYQYDYGLVLNLDGIELPTYFDCYFEVLGSDEAIPAVGTMNRVAIPNSCLLTEGMVTMTIPIHSGQNDSEVEYVVRFRVIGRARPVDDGSPEEQSALARAIAWLQHPLESLEDIVRAALDDYGDLSGHTHGHITNDGDISYLTTISNGDRLVIRDSSAFKLASSSIQFGSNTHRFLRNDGSWAIPTRQYTNLWSGTATAATASITLADSVGNYDRIEIYGEDGLYGMVPYGEYSVVIPAIKKYDGHMYAEWLTVSMSGTEVTLSSTRWQDYEGVAPLAAYACITKIVGIKY